MRNLITCLAISKNGLMGYDVPKNYYLPWKSINEDIVRLKATINNKAVIITRSSYELLPNSFKNYIYNHSKLIIILTTQLMFIDNPKIIDTPIDTKISPKSQLDKYIDNETDAVYIGGSYLAEYFINYSDYSFITIVNNNKIIKDIDHKLVSKINWRNITE